VRVLQAASLGLCLAFYFVLADAGTDVFTTATPASYYNFLTDAFVHGQTSLLVKPRAELLALRDPYDPKANEAYRMHDALLYKGHYYLYWGLSPVLLAYLPVRIVTGRWLTDATACIIFASLGLLLYASLLVAIRKDYFPTSSGWTMIPLIWLLAFGTMMPFVLRRHLVYEVAITCGYFLTAVFLLAIYRGAFRGALHRGWIIASGVALGLVFLCRLNLTVCILTALVACFLYARRADRAGISRGHVLGLAFGPLVLCVAVQAFYNYARFGSLTDYGMRYQITMVYMPSYTFFSVPRGLSSALYIFFSLPIVSTHAPFLTATAHGLIGPWRQVAEALQPYVPDFHVEPIVGILVAVPLLLTLVLAPFVRARESQEDLKWFFTSILVAAAVQFAFICIAFAPITRYEVDFMPMLLLALAIVMLRIDRRPKTRRTSICLRTGLIALSLYTVLVSATVGLTDFVDTGPAVSLQPRGSLSISFAGEAPERLQRGDEVVRSGQRCRILRERVAQTVVGAGHPPEHQVQALLVRAEAHEHRTEHRCVPPRRVPAKDLAFVAVYVDGGARDVRIFGHHILGKFDAVRLGATDHALLRRLGQRVPIGDLVAPLLKEQHAAAGPGLGVGDGRDRRRDHQRRVLRAVLEAGQVAAMPIRPTSEFALEIGDAGEPSDRLARHVEDVVVRRARHPEPKIGLRRRHRVAARAGQRSIESAQRVRRCVRRDRAPQVGAKADDDVRRIDGFPRLRKIDDAAHERSRVFARRQREFEVDVGGVTQRENSGLRRCHERSVSPWCRPT
jgi:hypothetical protein